MQLMSNSLFLGQSSAIYRGLIVEVCDKEATSWLNAVNQ